MKKFVITLIVVLTMMVTITAAASAATVEEPAYTPVAAPEGYLYPCTTVAAPEGYETHERFTYVPVAAPEGYTYPCTLVAAPEGYAYLCMLVAAPEWYEPQESVIGSPLIGWSWEYIDSLAAETGWTVIEPETDSEILRSYTKTTDDLEYHINFFATEVIACVHSTVDDFPGALACYRATCSEEMVISEYNIIAELLG